MDHNGCINIALTVFKDVENYCYQKFVTFVIIKKGFNSISSIFENSFCFEIHQVFKYLD